MADYYLEGVIEERLKVINERGSQTIKAVYELFRTVKRIKNYLSRTDPEAFNLEKANAALSDWVHGPGKFLDGVKFSTLWKLDSQVEHTVKLANVARLRPQIIETYSPFDEDATYQVEVTAHATVAILCNCFWLYHWSIAPSFDVDLLPYNGDEFERLIRDAARDFGDTTESELLMLQGWIEIEFLQTLSHLRSNSGSQNPGQQHDKDKKVENTLPENPDVADLCLYLKTQLRNFSTQAACARSFCEKNKIDGNKAENLLRQAKRFPHLWKS